VWTPYRVAHAHRFPQERGVATLDKRNTCMFAPKGGMGSKF